MLTYSFTNIGSDHLYEHLYKCIKNDIITSVLTPGTRLPSKRSFAANLGISTITVEAAYAQLLAEGYIYSLPKKGYYVEEIHSEGKLNGTQEKFPQRKPEPPAYFADFVSNQTERRIFHSPYGRKFYAKSC